MWGRNGEVGVNDLCRRKAFNLHFRIFFCCATPGNLLHTTNHVPLHQMLWFIRQDDEARKTFPQLTFFSLFSVLRLFAHLSSLSFRLQRSEKLSIDILKRWESSQNKKLRRKLKPLFRLTIDCTTFINHKSLFFFESSTFPAPTAETMEKQFTSSHPTPQPF